MTTALRTTLIERVATAPISWGVCEVPGWGYQLPAERVLVEMADAGFTHTELGATGFLPADPSRLRAMLDSHGLSLLGGFIPLVLHEKDHRAATLAEAQRTAELIAAAGGRFFLTCAIGSEDCWREAPLSDAQFDVLCETLDEVDSLVTAHGLVQAFHSHYASAVETDAELWRVLDGSGSPIVLDTAHLTLGGTDVLALTRRHAHRVEILHLKDVDPAVAKRLVGGELSLMQAVQRGVFPPLGQGHVPIAEIVTHFEDSGRDLWYVLEQDAAIAQGDPSAVAQLRRNAADSLNFLRSLVPAAAGSGAIHNNHRFPEG